jgi:NAD(P)-dependent dehydrogenase (short-subunit alcohol dehydrogenase family)
MVPAETRDARSSAVDISEPLTIVGGGEVAKAIHAQITATGGESEIVALADWVAGFADCLNRRCPGHLWFVAPPAQNLDAFQASREFAPLLASLQLWVERHERSGTLERATLAAMTRMGGDFGFCTDGQGYSGGAFSGLFKGIRREYPMLRVKVVDFAESEDPQTLGTSFIDELRNGCTELEVGYRQGRRMVVTAVAEEAKLEHPAPSAGKVWVITGGGRGVTAAVARETGAAWGLHLHLLGTAPLPAPDAVWRGLDEAGRKRLRRNLAMQAREQGTTPDQLWRPIEKEMELDRTLDSFEQAGVRARYHQCDISDRESLRRTLDTIRSEDGPIQGIVHGAGVEAACRFARKRPEMVHMTLASKCDGAANLIALTRQDPLRYFVGFGSTSGRFGGLGQTDYSLASDLLAKMVGRLADERPDCKAVCFHWPAWDDIGMAARPESRVALERAGLSFMSPKEGISHFAAELMTPGEEHEVLILDSPGVLDSDGTMTRAVIPPREGTTGLKDVSAASNEQPASASSPTLLTNGRERQATPFVQDLRPGATADEAYADFLLDPTKDPFLIHHVLRGKPILPAVMTMQAFAEAARMFCPEKRFCGFRDVLLGSGVVVEPGTTPVTSIRLTRLTNGVRCELLVPFVNPQGALVDRERPFASAVAEFDTETDLSQVEIKEPLFGWTPFYYPPVAPIIHGEPLQTFKSLAFRHGAGLALIEARDPIHLLGNRSLQGTAVPAAELDGCLVACGFFVYAMVNPGFNLPYTIASCRLSGPVKTEGPYHLQFSYLGPSQSGHRFDFVLAGDSGEVLIEVKGYDTTTIKE